MKEGMCSCGARVIWARIEPSGKRHPVDADPTEDGNVALTRRGDVVIARVLKKGEAWPHPKRKSHFATCPDAAQYRKEK